MTDLAAAPLQSPIHDPVAWWRSRSTVSRAGVILTVAALVWLIADAALPQGAPLGVVLLGVVQGSPNALTALGLVLIWRANRVINFSAAAIGAVSGGFAVKTFSVWDWPYPVTLILAPLLGLLVGFVVEFVIIRRFANASRLVLGVATLGLTQLLGGLDLILGDKIFDSSAAFSSGYETPLTSHTAKVGAVTFNGDHLLAVAVVPIAAALLAWFLQRSVYGMAIRGAAENEERALLLGIPVRRLHAMVWAVTGCLAGLTYAVQFPFDGAINSAVTGPTLLLPALAAAVVAGMESMPKAFAAALTLGVIDQVARWNAGTKPQLVGLVFFVVILGALLARRKDTGRGSRPAGAGWDGPPVLRGLPSQIRRLPEIRVLTVLAWLSVLGLGIGVPFWISVSQVTTATQTLMWCMVGLSLVVLSGWAGQISLGQFAFVGVGAMVCGNLIAGPNVDVFLAVLASAVAAGLIALVLGGPALRIPGPFLAVVTLAFAAVFDSVVLNDKVLGDLVPGDVSRPTLLARWEMSDERVLYWFAFGLFMVLVAVVRGVRNARSGRLLLAVRDNDRAAEACGAPARRQVLAGFVLSGMICGVGGAVYVLAVGGLTTGDFPPAMSVEVFSQTVIGGLGSVLGAASGVIGMRSLSNSLDTTGRLLLGGTGLLGVLWLLPGGLARLMGWVRDGVVARLAARHDLGLDGAALAASAPVAQRDVVRHADDGQTVDGQADDGHAAVTCRGVNVSYGSLQVLFDVDLDIASDEIVALLGTNGAGKSTVLRALCGLTKSNGRFRLGEVDLTGMSADRRAKAGLAMMPGGRSIFPSLTVEENLRLALWLRRHDSGASGLHDRALERFPALLDHLDRRAGDLSGGQQQQLALAQTLMLEPKVLLIDELSLGLAPSVVAQLIEVVRDINRGGVPVLVVEQSVNVAMTLAERAVFMEKGTVRFSGPTTDLAERPDLLRAVFLDGASDTLVGRDRADDEQNEPGVFDGIQLDDNLIVVGDVVDLRPHDSDVVLECREVTLSFGGLRALDGVDLAVRRGEIVGLVGQNGAGKTTLLDCISGFLDADGGHIAICGQEVTGWSPSRRALVGMGRSFQEARLFPSLSVLETVAVACERHVRNTSMLADAMRQPASFEVEMAVATRAIELLDLLSLGVHRNKLTSELSTGMRRIVELACLLAAGPDVLLLDEPSAGVAQRETEALGPLLRQIRDQTGAAIVVIEHDMPLLRGLCDRLVALDLGRVIAEGDPETVLADQRVIAAYLGDDATAIERSG